MSTHFLTLPATLALQGRDVDGELTIRARITDCSCATDRGTEGGEEIDLQPWTFLPDNPKAYTPVSMITGPYADASSRWLMDNGAEVLAALEKERQG